MTPLNTNSQQTPQPNTANIVTAAVTQQAVVDPFSGYHGTPLLPLLEHFVCEAIARHHERELIGYMTGLTVVPGEAPGQFVPVSVIVLTREPAGGPPVYATSLSMDLHLDQEAVEKIVVGLLDQMGTGPEPAV